MKRRKTQVCALCGQIREVTREHVPPKCLFPTPQRSPLILRTCARCNNGSTESDEEFGTLLNLFRNDSTKDTGANWNRAFRSLRNQRKMLRSLLATTEKVLLTSESGIVIGPGYTFRWPIWRLLPTAEKIARLLFFHHNKQPVPPHLSVSTYEIDPTGQPEGEELVRRSSILEIAQSCELGATEFPEVFTYRWGCANDEVEASVWITTFMERVVFVTFITPHGIDSEELFSVQ